MRKLTLIVAFPPILACGLGCSIPASIFDREAAIASVQVYLFGVKNGTKDGSEAVDSAATELFDDLGLVSVSWDAAQASDGNARLVSLVVQGRGRPPSAVRPHIGGNALSSRMSFSYRIKQGMFRRRGPAVLLALFLQAGAEGVVRLEGQFAEGFGHGRALSGQTFTAEHAEIAEISNVVYPFCSLRSLRSQR